MMKGRGKGKDRTWDSAKHRTVPNIGKGKGQEREKQTASTKHRKGKNIGKDET